MAFTLSLSSLQSCASHGMAQTAKVRGLGQRSAFVACFTDDSRHISVPCFVLLCVSVCVCVSVCSWCLLHCEGGGEGMSVVAVWSVC